MKIRQHRKRKLALFRSHRAFLWSTIKCIKKISEAQLKMSKALEEAYAKARQEKALQALHDENERLGLYDEAYGIPFVEKDQLKKLLGTDEKK